RHLESEPPAERAADEVHAAKVEALEKIEVKIRQIVDVLEPLGLVGCAETRVLGDEHIEVLGELLHERHDRRRPVRPVQIKEGLARSTAAEVDPATAGFGETLRERHV